MNADARRRTLAALAALLLLYAASGAGAQSPPDERTAQPIERTPLPIERTTLLIERLSSFVSRLSRSSPRLTCRLSGAAQVSRLRFTRAVTITPPGPPHPPRPNPLTVGGVGEDEVGGPAALGVCFNRLPGAIIEPPVTFYVCPSAILLINRQKSA